MTLGGGFSPEREEREVSCTVYQVQTFPMGSSWLAEAVFVPLGKPFPGSTDRSTEAMAAAAVQTGAFLAI